MNLPLIEQTLVLIGNYGLPLFIVAMLIIALTIFFKYFLKDYIEERRIKTQEHTNFQKTQDDVLNKVLANAIAPNAEIEKYKNHIRVLEEKIEELNSTLDMRKLKNLKHHDLFFQLKYHMKLATQLEFDDVYSTWCFRKIIEHKLEEIEKGAQLLLELETFYNVDDVNDIPHRIVVEEIDGSIGTIIKQYNDKILCDFKKKFGFSKYKEILYSPCHIENCTRIPGECNKNLGECIFNKIMNDPKKGFNKWHNEETVSTITQNLEYYKNDKTCDNVELIRNTLTEYVKGANTAICHVHKAFNHFNGDLHKLFDYYEDHKNDK